MKENCANWELSHVPTKVTKVEKIFSLHSKLLTTVVSKIFVELKFIENHSPHTIRSQIPKLYILPKIIKSSTDLSTQQKTRQT